MVDIGEPDGFGQVDAQEIADKGDPTELIAARMVAAEHGCLAIKDNNIPKLLIHRLFYH